MNGKQEYLVINDRFLILEKSLGVFRYLDRSISFKTGKDIRLCFPELVGLEEVLNEIFLRDKLSFELQDICRCGDRSRDPVYFNVYFSLASKERLIIIFEDVTEKNAKYQNKIQAANECRLLSNKISADSEYLQQVIESSKEILLITDRFGKIENLSLATLELFGYSKKELLNRSIAILFHNNKISFSDLILLQDLDITCQTKTKQKLALTFSISSISDRANKYPDFIFVGRKIG